ncbi:MAG: hypothetical protein JW873_02520 [Candidatus Saganbacteria bacterium]|nr:hypothetical protein [Candidatus Saganbacteria bacterium]
MATVDSCGSAINNWYKVADKISEACDPKTPGKLDLHKCDAAVKEMKEAQSLVDRYCRLD